MFTVNLYGRNFEDIAETQIKLRPVRFSAIAIGGYEYAELDLEGTAAELKNALGWLRYYVIIRNRNHNAVWCGFVTGVSVNMGGKVREKTIDSMTNRIAVAYTYDDANGQAVRETTDWADNLTTQSKYGVIERFESQGDMSADEAESLRDNALDIYGRPSLSRSIGQKTPGGSLQCRGLWSHLSWKIYNQPGGVVQYDDTGSYEHYIGWSLTSDTIGFDEWEDGIHDINARFDALREDDYIVVSGAAEVANNGTFKITRRAFDEEPENYTDTAIHFDPSDDILADFGGLGFIDSRSLILVSGSAAPGNNGYKFTKESNSSDHITVNPSTITLEPAGIPITIVQGHSVLLDTALTTEYPGATVTVTALGVVVAQSFTLPVNVPFTVAEIYVRVKKVGGPADSFKVGLRADSGGSPSGTDLEIATILGSALGDQMTWVKFTMAGTTALTYGATYWLLVSRTSSYSIDNYYVTELNEDAGYTDGAVKLWNGSAWVTRAVDADLPFQIWSHRQTTDQISDMLTSGNQLFSGYEIKDASGKYKRQFREEDQTTQVEIENLLKLGTNAGKRLLSRVSPQRMVQIYAEPTANDQIDDMMLDDGSIVAVTGVPLEEGYLPVGKWISDADRPVYADPDDDPPAQFLERAEWDCEINDFSALEFKGAENPWEVVRL